jgi:hypothetical protein
MSKHHDYQFSWMKEVLTARVHLIAHVESSRLSAAQRYHLKTNHEVFSWQLLEIPSSVVVLADFSFQFVIKSFEEGHSQQEIQRILDATMADRFAPRIADVCYFIKKIVHCKGRPNRSIFVVMDSTR